MASNNISITISAKDDASSVLKNVAQQIDDGSKAVSRFGKASALAFGAIAGAAATLANNAIHAIANSIDDAVSRVDTLNNFPRIMANFGVSAGDAKTMIDRLDKGVRGLPTTLNDIAQLAEGFVPLTKNTKEATDTALALNNAILAGGAPAQVQTAALEQFRQALSKGVPDLQDWKTLEMAMPAQLQQVTKQLGLGSGALSGYRQNGLGLYQAMKDGKLSMEDFNQAIIKLNSNGVGGLPSLAEQAKNATQGIQTGMANARTAVTRGIADIIQAIGSQNISNAISSVGKAFESAMKDISQSVGPVMEALGPSWNQLMQTMEQHMPEIQHIAATIGKDLVGALQGTLNLLSHVLPPFIDFLNWCADHQAAVVGIALAIGGIKAALNIKASIDAFRAGFAVAESAAKSSAATTAAAWVLSAARTSAVWVVTELPKIVTGFIATAASAAMHAVATSAVWIANAAKTSAAWVVTELPKIIASMAWVATTSALHAADTALAWVLNAVRVSTEWVVLQMPKLVASFVATAASATLQAGITAGAWIANAARSSFAWVTTELPRIVSGFVATAASAVAQAAVAAAAWIASASSSAVAWVVTEMPRIIGAFVAGAGAAIAQAAIVSGAWIASAASASASWIASIVTSSASYSAFAALVSSPIAMGAIAVAGALADIALVMQAVQSVRGAIEAMNNAADARAADAKNTADTANQMRLLQRTGTSAQKARATDWLSTFAPSRAGGGPVQQGTSYLVGENGPEMFTPSTSGNISHNTASTNITISGNITIASAEAANAFWDRIDKTQRLARIGMAGATP